MDFLRRQPIDQSERSYYKSAARDALACATASWIMGSREFVASLACRVSCDRGWNLTPQGLKTLMCLWDLVLALAPAFRVLESVSREELSCPGSVSVNTIGYRSFCSQDRFM